jgi:hypothetical protein
VYDSDQYIGSNVTTYGIGSGYSGPTSGQLKDQATGEDMGITVTLTENGGVSWQPSSTYGGSDCAAGTDAYNTFSGIADMTGVINYGNTGWWVDLAFTGLDPATEYTFATSAARCLYTNRLTIYTLSGADTYTNASTTGVDVLANNKVRFNTGDNYNEGYVARWTGIKASDGTFKVRAESDPGSTAGRRAYAFDVFKLEGGLGGSDLQNDMLGVNASLWIRLEFQVDDPSVFDKLVLRMRHEDGFVAYLNGERVARDNAPNTVQWDSTALSDRPDGDSLVFEEINLMPYLGLLQPIPAKNVLAIHGLNDSKDDPNFLILPELAAASDMGVHQYFTSPTPRNFNIPGAIDRAGNVWFSHKRGFYHSPFQLALFSETDDAQIRYTLDGSRPTITHGLTYTGPVDVNQTTTFRAGAFKPGWLESDIETHTYIFLDKVIQQPTNPPGFPTNWGHTGNGDYEMDPEVVTAYSSTIKDDLKSVPTLSLVMNVDDWFGSSQGIYIQGERSERAVSAELLFPDGSEGFQINCCVMIVGGSSVYRWKMDKLSMRLKFKGEYGPTELRFPVFGDEASDEFDTLVVDARMNNIWAYGGGVLLPYNSRPWIVGRPTQRDVAQYTRDQFVSDIQNATGGYGTHGRHVHLYLNGLYWGLYWLHERPDEHFAADYFGGDDDDYDVLKHNSNTVINGYGTNYNEMFSIANAGLASDSQYQLIQQYLDVPNLIDYMITNFYVGNTDWAHHNWYATRSRVDPAGRWRYHSWDAEHVMEALNENVTYRDNSGGPTRLHQRLRDNADYRMLFADHVHRHFFNNGLLTSEGATALYTERLNEVDRAVVAESARWGDNHRIAPYTRDIDWVTERDWLLGVYFQQRTNIVLDQLRVAGLYPDVNAPTFSHPGGQVRSGFGLAMTAPTGAIYYTTDGNDPRQPDGSISPSAVVYTTALTLTKSAHVKARVLDDGKWSALCEATFAVGPVHKSLRITEIMFHPQDANDPNLEYVELKIGPRTRDWIPAYTLNLNMARFTEGIHFTFPDMYFGPHQYLVIVKDREAFEARYGTSALILGEYTGRLDNTGERIRLEDAIGQTILDFEYNDRWCPITDGDGFSLTIIDPLGTAQSWGEKGSWRASAYAGGSPGVDDTGIVPNPGAIVINELLAHSHDGAPDWIELHNTTSQPIDIGGWFLSDNDRDDPNVMKYRIANGTTIDPNGYIVFYQDVNFGTLSDPGCNIHFAYSENGESAYLSSGLDANGVLTGYREAEDFGASETGVSFGRYYKASTNNFNFVAMDSNTPGWANSSPKVGPIVVSEIMYNPATGNQKGRAVEVHRWH